MLLYDLQPETRVTHPFFGNGSVSELRHQFCRYPIEVTFDSGEVVEFTRDGRLDEDDFFTLQLL